MKILGIGVDLIENKRIGNLINNKSYIAESKSKKDAEQNAAILCLQNIKKI